MAWRSFAKILSLVLVLQTAPAFAIIYDQSDLGQILSLMIEGNCLDQMKNLRLKDQCGVPKALDPSQIEDLEKISHSVVMNAVVDQSHRRFAETLKCEIPKLKAMNAETPEALKFQKHVLSDIADKLPNLRSLFNASQGEKAKVSELWAERNKIYGMLADHRGTTLQVRQGLQRQLTELQTKISAQEKKTSDAENVFQALRSSVWRGESTQMIKFVTDAIYSHLSPEDFITEAMRKNRTGSLGENIPLIGNKFHNPNDLSFREQVLGSMLSDSSEAARAVCINSSNSNTLYARRAMASGDPLACLSQPIGSWDTLEEKYARTLLQNTEWAPVFEDLNLADNLQNAFTMCLLNQKYIDGIDRARWVEAAVSVAAPIVRGVGLLPKAAQFLTNAEGTAASGIIRYASMAKFSRVLQSSRIARFHDIAAPYTYLGFVTGTQLTIEEIEQHCLPVSLQNSYKSTSCSPEDNVNWSDVEIKDITRSNCFLSLMAPIVSLKVGAYLYRTEKINSAVKNAKNTIIQARKKKRSSP